MELTSKRSIYGLILQVVQDMINMTLDLCRKLFFLKLFVGVNRTSVRLRYRGIK
jgi:hypothetical protein